MRISHYDAAVIGAGQGGTLAKYLALAGRRTALIERRWLGGSCINWGCTPTKTLIASAHVAHQVRQAGQLGVKVIPPEIDWRAIRQRKRKMVQEFRSDYHSAVDQIDCLDVICGEARFCNHKTLQIDLSDGETQQITADIIVIATGSCSSVPDIPGLTECGYLTPETLMEWDEIPQHLLILGGGYIAVEFAQMFRRFGAQVTILQRNDQLIPREDADVANALQDVFRSEGIEILFDCHTSLITKEEHQIHITAKIKKQEQHITGSHLLLAAGHTPNTKTLDIQRTDIALDKKSYIRTNDSLETTVPGIYAMGDVKGGPAFTHIAQDDTRLLRANLLHGKKETLAGRIVPYVIFTDPQLGRAGITEKEAQQKNLDVRIASLPLNQTARGLETGETAGLLKAVIDTKSHHLLGATVLAPAGGEVIAVLQIAIQTHLPYTMLRDNIFAHPTLAESINNLFLEMDKK